MRKNNDGKPRAPKLTIKTISERLDKIESAIVDGASQIARMRAYDSEKIQIKTDLENMRARLENANAMVGRENARAEILGEIVDRLIGTKVAVVGDRNKMDPIQEAPHNSTSEFKGRFCGTCGRS